MAFGPGWFSDFRRRIGMCDRGVNHYAAADFELRIDFHAVRVTNGNDQPASCETTRRDAYSRLAEGEIRPNNVAHVVSLFGS